MADAPTPQEVIGRRRTALRVERGYSQRQLADLADLSHAVVIRAEKGEDIDGDSVRKLADALGAAAGDYFDPKGSPALQQPEVTETGR